MNVRFVGLPRKEMFAALAETPGWHDMGHRMRDRATRMCPVGERESGDDGTAHLNESIEVKFIGGEDPRILIGSKQQTSGRNPISKLWAVTDGTDPHSIDPVDANVLHFITGGQEVFTKHVEHPGTSPNPFVIDAMRAVLHET